MAKLYPIRQQTLALVGGNTLVGRELRELVSAGSSFSLKLVAADDKQVGKLTELGGGPVIVGRLDAESFSGAKAVFLAGTAESTRKALDAAPEGQFIDLTYGAEDNPRARLRAPVLEPAGYTVPDDAVHVIAHPAAIAIALVLSRLHQDHRISRSVVHVFEPASERGASGMEELQQQTVNLLSLKKLPTEVYDGQVGFNLLARFGEQAAVPLEQVELRIERHLATLLSLSGAAPMPSLRLIQAPVFHGHSCSLWVEFESNPGVEAIERALSSELIDVRGADLEPPSIAGIAEQGGIAVGAVALDRNHPDACWLWMVADNLRLTAENAIAVAQQLVA